MLPLLDLKNDYNGMVLLFNKNVRILITENAGSEGVYRAVLTGMLNRIQCVRTMLLAVSSRLKRSIIMRSFSMFHRLREYIDIKKCGIAQFSYAITYSRGGGV